VQLVESLGVDGEHVLAVEGRVFSLIFVLGQLFGEALPCLTKAVGGGFGGDDFMVMYELIGW
jgi:hypothetical protein